MWHKSGLLIFFILCATPILANDFSFFDGDMNFWSKPAKKSNKKVEIKSNESSAKENSKFDWKKYLDPKSKEFFKEGNYTPPAPLMEAITLFRHYSFGACVTVIFATVICLRMIMV